MALQGVPARPLAWLTTVARNLGQAVELEVMRANVEVMERVMEKLQIARRLEMLDAAGDERRETAT